MLLDIFVMEEYMIPCLSKKLFGIDCLGCGMQRSLVLLIKGEFYDAFLMYPAIYPMLVFFGLIGMQQLQKKINLHPYIVFFGTITAITMVVSYFYKFFNYA